MNPLVSLQWRDWGGDSVAYEASSGQTHQLDPLTATVVARFEERPASIGELCGLLIDTVDALDPSELRDKLQDIIDRLVVMGWLQPCHT